jgi:hypothetical protein
MKTADVISKLAENLTVFESITEGITHDQARWRPEPDRWSVLEVVNHLHDEEIEDFRLCSDILINSPEKDWPSFNPGDWVTNRSYNTRDIDNSVSYLVTERQKSLDWLRGLDDPDWNVKHAGSNRFEKPMKVGDILVAWIAHDFFHIRQLINLKWEYLMETCKPFSSRYAGPYLT